MKKTVVRVAGLTRRGFLGGSAAAAVGLACPAHATGAEESVSRPAMIIDLNKCIGCQSCTIACRAVHSRQSNFLGRVEIAEDAREARSVFTPKNCNQCKDPACLHACRHKAIAKGIDGVVRIDRARCKGCGECVKACPFGEIFLEKTEGKAVKCEFCRGDRGVPACVEACASHARLFGDTLHPEGAFAEALKNARLKALDADFKDKLSGTCYIELARS